MIELTIERTVRVSHELTDLPSDDPCRPRHEHDLTVRFTIGGEPGPYGWVVRFARLVDIWDEFVADDLAGSDANTLIKKPTVENLAKWIADRLAWWIENEGAQLLSVEVHEQIDGGSAWATWRGGQ